MNLSDHTILVTGGSDGIGFALSKALAVHNRVIICGRSQQKLDLAKQQVPELITFCCDVNSAEQREKLLTEVLTAHPQLNILINNAGAKQVIDPYSDESVTAALRTDTELNFIAPVELCQLFRPHLKKQPTAAIINITTGLIYFPKAAYPFYCAAKSALHSYTRSLRWSLRGSGVRIIEVMMPLVDTTFHKGRLPATSQAISPQKAAELCIRDIEKGKQTVRIGTTARMRWIAALFPDKGIKLVNR